MITTTNRMAMGFDPKWTKREVASVVALMIIFWPLRPFLWIWNNCRRAR